jgi:protein-S-isoprenylcysteine O-methyltransferase Ste14
VGARLEERKLEVEFGSAYAAYQQKTPMLVPGANLFNRSQKIA